MPSVWDKFKNLKELRLIFKDLHDASGGIYANGRNQIEVEIFVKAYGQDGNILPLTKNDIRDKVHLCDFEDGQSLESRWAVSDSPNDFTKGFRPNSTNTITQLLDTAVVNAQGSTANSDVTYVSKYLSCTERNSEKTFAVGIDVPGVGKFDTTRNGTTTRNGPSGESGSQFKSPNALTVIAIPEITYIEDNIKIDKIFARNRTRNIVNYVRNVLWTRYYFKDYDTHYDNYYITVENGIKRVDLHSYDETGEYKWIAEFTSENHNYHMILMHPFNTGTKTETFGFKKTLHEPGQPIDIKGEFDFTQNVTYNDQPDALCITQLAYGTSTAWDFSDWMDFNSFNRNTWFDLYDIYGNHGQFKPVFTGDRRYIEIERK